MKPGCGKGHQRGSANRVFGGDDNRIETDRVTTVYTAGRTATEFGSIAVVPQQ
jgi:hypothetical protein